MVYMMRKYLPAIRSSSDGPPLFHDDCIVQFNPENLAGIRAGRHETVHREDGAGGCLTWAPDKMAYGRGGAWGREVCPRCGGVIEGPSLLPALAVGWIENGGVPA
jgi:hypothetical protein